MRRPREDVGEAREDEGGWTSSRHSQWVGRASMYDVQAIYGGLALERVLLADERVRV